MKYYLTFKILKTEKEARAFCENENAGATRYIRKHKPATFTPWESGDGFRGFVVWYHYARG